MISREDSPESISEAETSQAETANSFTNSVETSEWDASGLDALAESSADSSLDALGLVAAEDDESEQDVSVSVVYVPASASDFVIEAVDAYEPEYLNYNLYFGIVFGFYIVLRLMRFVRKALFVRFDGSTKEA